MGQYFKGTSYRMRKGVKVSIESLESWDYENGAKLMEHSYVGNNYVNEIEKLISLGGKWYGKRIVWAGDYEDVPDNENLLYDLGKVVKPKETDYIQFEYVINRSKREYVVVSKTPITRYDMKIHPLPLLTSNSYGFGGIGNLELVGSWCGDIVIVSNELPKGYKEIIFDLTEAVLF